MGIHSFLDKVKSSIKTGSKPVGKAVVGGRSYTQYEGGLMVADPIPVEKRIAGKGPGPSGLYPHEVLMLSYAEHFPINGAQFQSFWWFRYGVRDPAVLLYSLYQRGFIKVGSFIQTLRNAKVSELKDACKYLDLKTAGKKDDLVERLSGCEVALKAAGLFQEWFYEPTEKGKAALEQEPYIPWVHAHPESNLDIWTIGAAVGGGGQRHWRDYQWGNLNKQSMQFISAREFGSYRNTRLAMCEFLAEEKRALDALRMAVEVESLDLNGAVNGLTPEAAGLIIRDMVPYGESTLRSAPGVVKMIKKLAKEAGLANDGLDRFVLETAQAVVNSTPMRAFTPDEVAQVIKLELAGDPEALTSLYKQVKARQFKGR